MSDKAVALDRVLLELPDGTLESFLVSWLQAHDYTPENTVVVENTSVEDDGSVSMRISFEVKQ